MIKHRLKKAVFFSVGSVKILVGSNHIMKGGVP